ncbi:MAG: hypothetical protein DRI56_04850 [Chloroflexota bacterium]|nr:MAG: hypothetical protein DRI56_04850 [Chloroflexota bacterium]
MSDSFIFFAFQRHTGLLYYTQKLDVLITKNGNEEKAKATSYIIYMRNKPKFSNACLKIVRIKGKPPRFNGQTSEV